MSHLLSRESNIVMPDQEYSSPEFDAAIEETAGIKRAQATEEDTTPLYRVMDGSKIPVSKKLGMLWKARKASACSSRRPAEVCWSEAIRYYQNDQMSHRQEGADDRSGNRRFQRRINDHWSATENVVFSNAVTALPMLYAKNPSVEITPISEAVSKEFAQTAESLINTLLNMKTAPGLNFKSKGRRGVLWALLTNNAYSKVDFISKQEGSEEAMAELNRISEEYAKAKTQKDIKRLEGELVALEERVSILNPSGPRVTLVNPFNLYWDPNSKEPDHSDAMWCMEMEFLPTDYINAVYAKKHDKQYVSVYEPTHILNGGADPESDELSNFKLFDTGGTQQAKAYGYENEAQFKNAQYTKVWWVWDKVTRRVFLFADNNWKWPLWVWDDPLGLVEFFPYDHLWFHETPEGSQPKGEVTYYLDQQDSINDKNSTLAQALTWARIKVFYNKELISQEAVERVLNGDMNAAEGIEVPEGMKINDLIFSVVPPSLQYEQLFNIDKEFAAINRITGINDAQRGAQFKTNTTNEAIDFYQKNVDIRVDEKIDAIEDWIGMIAWKVLQLLAKHWRTEDVAEIIGADKAAGWAQISNPSELRTKFLVRIVGGSTDKPTSKNKKEAALKVGQILGQFANAIPAVGVVMLKVMERAFKDDITITDEDWKMIFETMTAQQQKAGGGPGGESGAPQQEGVTPEQEQQIKDQIAALPPQAQQAMQQAIQQGVPPAEALQLVQQQAQQTRQ